MRRMRRRKRKRRKRKRKRKKGRMRRERSGMVAAAMPCETAPVFSGFLHGRKRGRWRERGLLGRCFMEVGVTWKFRRMDERGEYHCFWSWMHGLSGGDVDGRPECFSVCTRRNDG
jgi:hypothetical protein